MTDQKRAVQVSESIALNLSQLEGLPEEVRKWEDLPTWAKDAIKNHLTKMGEYIKNCAYWLDKLKT